jgi:hypothetical protein
MEESQEGHDTQSGSWPFGALNSCATNNCNSIYHMLRCKTVFIVLGLLELVF